MKSTIKWLVGGNAIAFPSIIRWVTPKIGIERRLKLLRHYVGRQKSYAGSERINDEVAETRVAARNEELRDLNRTSEDEQRNRD
jgi:hypothetical protein